MSATCCYVLLRVAGLQVFKSQTAWSLSPRGGEGLVQQVGPGGLHQESSAPPFQKSH